jgi:hypothetical protein
LQPLPTDLHGNGFTEGRTPVGNHHSATIQIEDIHARTSKDLQEIERVLSIGWAIK